MDLQLHTRGLITFFDTEDEVVEEFMQYLLFCGNNMEEEREEVIDMQWLKEVRNVTEWTKELRDVHEYYELKIKVDERCVKGVEGGLTVRYSLYKYYGGYSGDLNISINSDDYKVYIQQSSDDPLEAEYLEQLYKEFNGEDNYIDAIKIEMRMHV